MIRENNRRMHLRFHILIAFSVFIPSSLSAYWQAEIIDTDSDELLRSVMIHSSGNIILSGEDNTILVSKDQGKNWEEAEIPDVSGFGESDDISIRRIVELRGSKKLLALGVINKSHQSGPVGMVSGPGPSWHTSRTEKWTAVLTSSDGGTTWTLAEKIDEAALYWPFIFSDGQCILFGYADSTYEFRNGRIFTTAANRLPNKNGSRISPIPFFGSAAINDTRLVTQYRDYLFAVEEHSVIGVSLDRGHSWSVLQSENYPDDINAIAVLDERRIIAACDNGTVAISEDAGNSWRTTTITEHDLNAVYASPQCDWWLAGDEGYIAFSSNSGADWTRLETDSDEDLSAVHFNSGCSNGWVLGNDGTAIHIFDKRNSSPVLPLKTPDEAITWSERAKNDRNTWYVPTEKEKGLKQGLSLSVRPPDATVRIGDRTYSGSQLFVPLPPGKHYLRVEKKGCFPEEDSIEIEFGSVEEENVTLRPLKITVSPSGALFTDLSTYGLLFSIQAGILGNSRNGTGILLDAGVSISEQSSVIDLCGFYSHRFDIGNSFFISPFCAAGALNVRTVADSMFIDSSGLPYESAHPDTIEDALRDEYYDVALQAGFDIQIRKHQNWGFSIKPSLLWAPKYGLHCILRFGAVIWIL
ncbi:MAG: hypothetical protein JW863_09135 [Chitinispirillaceae bacterium]|nr:hypothetical protein [Chitinispirillaceae bacterium]